MRFRSNRVSLSAPLTGRVVRLWDSAHGTVISIFLSVFNVHVNRAPIGGSIRSQEYRPGKFLMAFDDRASVENETDGLEDRG